MNRLVRALLGVVVAKAAIASAWYLYQKSTEQENDWKTEGEPEKPNKQDVKSETQPVVKSIPVEVTQQKQTVVDTEVVKPKRVRKPAAKKVETNSETQAQIPKRVRKPVAKNTETTATEQKKTTRSRTKKTQ